MIGRSVASHLKLSLRKTGPKLGPVGRGGKWPDQRWCWSASWEHICISGDSLVYAIGMTVHQESRSESISEAERRRIAEHDLKLLNEAADRLNIEAEDVLRYQDGELSGS